MVAVIRPDSWDLPLFIHVLGAMALVGTLVLASSALILAWQRGDAALVGLGFRSLLTGVLPAWIVMRVGAEWIASSGKENVVDSNDAWVGMGFTTADGGLVLIVIAIICGGLAVRRATGGEGSGGGLRRAAAILASVLLVAYLVTVWAMATKPT